MSVEIEKILMHLGHVLDMYNEVAAQLIQRM